MPYQVLSLKWRPQTFADLVGQKHVSQTLINAFKKDRVAQAYALTGPRGVGKTTTARIIAKALNCKSLQNFDPCNGCSNCKEITDGRNIDVIEIDGASNRGIDEIRELRENIKFMPVSGKFKVIIIDEVHMLTTQAFGSEDLYDFLSEIRKKKMLRLFGIAEEEDGEIFISDHALKHRT